MLWGIFQTGKFLREMATLSLTVQFQAMQVSNHYNTDYEQSTEAINVKPTPGTAPGTQVSAEVSYIFVSLSIGLPTLTN